MIFHKHITFIVKFNTVVQFSYTSAKSEGNLNKNSLLVFTKLTTFVPAFQLSITI